MKPIKMLGLAALAALMAMAFVGASSAAAHPTVLCNADVGVAGGCTEVTHIHETSVGKGVLKSSLPTIECTVLFLGDTEAGTSAPLVINGQFTYSACNNFCSVKEESAKAKIKVLTTASELTSVTGEGLVNVKCPFINCNYIGTGLEGHGLGPLTSSSANGNVVLTAQLTEKESGSCPEEAFLTLTTTPLTATYPRAMYCVNYEHEHGLYEKDGCVGKYPTPTKLYELVIGPGGLSAHEHVCVNQIEKPLNGLYKDSKCKEDDPKNESLYELGEILVE
jgi:hypothetical protein